MLFRDRSSSARHPQKPMKCWRRSSNGMESPLPGYIGGNEFRNRERRLPHGRYREYDVNRKTPGRSRGAERLVIEQRSGEGLLY